MSAIPQLDHILDSLSDKGYCIVPNFLAESLSQQLYQHAQAIPEQYWNTAAIGRATQQTVNTMVRNDRILWLSAEQAVENTYLKLMDELRTELNRQLFLGLFDYECHFAHYPKGAFYKKHLDAFKGRSNRRLTTVMYLNEDWQEQHGGQLVIYGDRGEILEQVTPERGTLVVFLSEKFVHEVLPSHRDRLSITGWFRINASISGIVDPPR
ncbi:proline hydroxylase [Idiomarina sp. OT37-5b]|jgi:SM-20-related protein|uniref:2OG-Fe(II) oxygenase n=1 Tax=Idiomarina sp. OT37-5b TaxID=2100422 RepID=UPI000CF9AEDD|nr:2OG-Fe(II) oxygenase [Idiomarina sp. OT37-5b]AVJ54974.1 proline hydroxylase [Idiomarina sp. OT37-5b]